MTPALSVAGSSIATRLSAWASARGALRVMRRLLDVLAFLVWLTLCARALLMALEVVR